MTFPRLPTKDHLPDDSRSPLSQTFRPGLPSSMRYQRSYLIFFQHSDWPLTLIAGSACMLVPVFGWGLLLGYIFETLDAPQQPDQSLPALDANRLSGYFRRGLPAALLHAAFWLPLFLLIVLVTGTLLYAGGPGRSPGVGAKLLASGLSVAILLIVLLVSLLLLPATFFLGRGREGGLLDALRFAQEFLKRVWRELLLAQIFVVATGLTLFALGVMLCGFGAPSALALMGFAQYQLLAQLYDLYLERGGAAIPRELAVPAASGA